MLRISNGDQMLSQGATLRGGDLTVDRLLSSGGFGNTYVVRNRLDKVFAMKEFFIKGINLRTDGVVTVSVPDNKTTFESQRTKFEKEAKRLSKIDNPHIVKVHDLFYENGTVYYTMDYIDGESLRERMDRTKKPLTEDEVGKILSQILDALSCVHGQHPALLHLDIKPGNIMVDKHGNIYLIDFGSSKQIDSEGNETFSTSTGYTYTQGYAPVELMMGVKENIGPWTDFYALGATAYNLLTCKSPKEVNLQKGDAGFNFPSSVSPKMRQLVAWLMKPFREDRPQNVRAIMDWLEEEHPVEQDGKNILDDEKTELGSVIVKPKKKAQKFGLRLRMKKEEYGLLILSFIILFVVILANCFGNEISSENNQADTIDMRTKLTPNVPVPHPQNSSNKENIDNLPLILQNLINNMVYVEGGAFMMGATGVTISSFSIGKYEVTQEEWEAVMGSNPSKFKGNMLPVERVSWYNCQDFISKLNALTGKQFRLPTIVQWQYAARGGNKSKDYKYAGSNDIGSVAWHEGNSGSKTHDVGQKQPNELGLYDMSGNVNEWCQDQDKVNYDCRVYYGGSWCEKEDYCRVKKYSNGHAPSGYYSYLGLRLVLL